MREAPSPTPLDKAANHARSARSEGEEDAPSSLDPAIFSVAAPTAPRRASRWRLIGRVAGALLVLGGPALFAQSLVRGDRSMDLATDSPVRVGLYRNGWFVHWVCSEGHDHFSAPFWLASLAISSAGMLVWRLSSRAAPRAQSAGQD